MTMSRDEARILISSLIEWYTEDIAERLGLSMGKETYMDALEVLWHGPEGELIRRSDAIDAVVSWTVEDRPHEVMPTDLVDRLKALPSADAKGRVISAEKLKRMKFVVIKGDKTEEAYRKGWNGAIGCVIDNVSPSAEAVQGKESGNKLDLISRASAIEAVIEDWDGYAKPLDSWDVMNRTRAVLETLPSAEAVQGEWVRCEGGIKDWEGTTVGYSYWYECDQCGAKPPLDQWRHEWHSNFCPNCGAKMKGGDSE